MQRSTGKELTIRRDEIRALLKETIDHHKYCEAARGSVESAKQVAMFHAWQAGIRLNKMKELVGHGHWMDWVEINFCKPRGVSIDTAELYMRIDNQNPHVRDLRNPKSEHVRNLEFDTIRKYAIGFVPEKEQPEHKGNERFARLVSFLNMANEYARLKQRHIEGLHQVDFEEAREELKEFYQFLRWLYGETKLNPWESTATPS